MHRAATLVHKGAMEIAIHSIRSFARYFSSTHSLAIHTDPSVGEEDRRLLLEAAGSMQASIVTSNDRSPKVQQMLADYPKTRELIKQGGILTKIELPIFEGNNYFFFDSDIIWLRHVTNLIPTDVPNAFSTETWTWYNGVANEHLWVNAKTPRRVNSGFHYLGEAFPYQKMEEMLAKDMFDANEHAGDQEIFAYLYNNLNYYHPEDLKRSRVGESYNLLKEECGALHFPGKMWKAHLEQIVQLAGAGSKKNMEARYLPAVLLTRAELIEMRMKVRLGQSTMLAKLINLFRKLRRKFK